MRSTFIFFNSLLVLGLTVFEPGEAFTGHSQTTSARITTSELYGKRARVMKKVKKILGGNDDATSDVVEPMVDTNFSNGKKVKLSNGRAKDLAKKYQNIDDIEERAFQVLLDLNMVGR